MQLEAIDAVGALQDSLGEQKPAVLERLRDLSASTNTLVSRRAAEVAKSIGAK